MKKASTLAIQALNQLALRGLRSPQSSGTSKRIPTRAREYRTPKALMRPMPPEVIRPQAAVADDRNRASPVELLIGVDPTEILHGTVYAVKNPAMRNFLKAFFAEQEVQDILTRRINTPLRYQRLRIELLRSAASQVQFNHALGKEEGDALFAAVLVRGFEQLLDHSTLWESDPKDVCFTIVRPALYRLEECAPRAAMLLRMALGWGKEDEVDDLYVPRLQTTVMRALAPVMERMGEV